MTTKVKSGDQLETAFITTGTSPDFEITKTGETALQDNEYFLVNFHDDANSAVTINVNSQGAHALEDEDGNPVTTIVIDTDYRVKWDVSKDAFVVIGAIGGGGGGGGGGSARSKTAKTAGVVYQAGPNGGIIVVSGINGASSGVTLRVLSDASNPPTIVVAQNEESSYRGGTITVPILPNMYYKVDNIAETLALCDFYEIGSGGFGSYVQAELSANEAMGGLISFDTVIESNGLTFDTTAHEFVAPVTGVYKICFTGVATCGSDLRANGKYTIKNNGTAVQYLGLGGRTGFAVGYACGSGEFIITLTLGDTITFESADNTGGGFVNIGGVGGTKAIIYY